MSDNHVFESKLQDLPLEWRSVESGLFSAGGFCSSDTVAFHTGGGEERKRIFSHVSLY